MGESVNTPNSENRLSELTANGELVARPKEKQHGTCESQRRSERPQTEAIDRDRELAMEEIGLALGVAPKQKG